MPVNRSVALLQLFRKTHLYVGVFIAPALLFFAFTGAIQTFSLHETTRGSDYKPAAFLVTMGQIHKKQTWIVPAKKPAPPAKPAGPEEPKPGVAPATPPPPPSKSHLPLKIFFLLVSLGLFTSTLTGLYMSYKYERNKILVTLLLIAGAVIPLALLPL